MGISNNLSERELEILRLVATGASNKEIAQRLQISMNTVKVHLRNVFEKTGVLSRTEATLYAIEHGLVTAPGQAITSEQDRPSFWLRHGSEIIRWGFVALIGMVIILVWNANQVRNQQPSMPSVALPRIVTATPAPLWKIHEESPIGLSGLTAVAFEGQILTFGGTMENGVNPDVFIFDPQLESWSQVSSKPTPVDHVKAAIIGERIYLPGGMTSNGTVTDVLEVYDPRTGLWEKSSSMPTGLADYGLTTYEGRIYLFGGWDGQQISDQVYEFNPSSREWIVKSPLPVPLRELAAADSHGRIYILGGKNDRGDSLDTYIYIPGRDHDGDQPWLPGTPMPGAADHIQAISIADNIFIIGIRTPVLSNGGLNIYQYTTQANEWAVLEPSPLAIGDAAGVVSAGNLLYVIGGTQSKITLKTNQSIQVIFTLNIPAINK
jgi:DNA-binding CsgD family transcriptional regulator